MLAFTWFEYAVASTVFTAVFWLSCRHLLKSESDHESLAVLLQFIPSLLWLPLLVFEPVVVPSGSAALSGWAFLFAAALAWAFQQMLAFKSLRMTSTSVREPIYQTKLIWAALFALAILGESFDPSKITGIVLLLAGAWIMAATPASGESSAQGVALVLFSALLTGLAYVLDKLALGYFSPTLYAIGVSLVCGIFTAAYVHRRGGLGRLMPFLEKHARSVLLASITGAASYWLMVKAISVGPVGPVAALLELAMVFTAVGGIVFLGERQAIGRKMAGIALAIVGALVLRGYLSFATG